MTDHDKTPTAEITTSMRWTPCALIRARDNDPKLWAQLEPQLVAIGYDFSRLENTDD